MNSSFQALVLEQRDGKTRVAIRRLNATDLPAGDVLVAVDYSSINYKDAMAVTGTGKRVLTGWGMGERHWGGYSRRVRVKVMSGKAHGRVVVDVNR
jgi:acrylyl-CoA reductase (NADPH)